MSDVPKNWTSATIADVTSYVQRGKSPKYVQSSKLPVINQKCIRWDGIREEHLKFVDPAQWSAWGEERFLRTGDVLWSSTGTGTIGRACHYKGIATSDRVVADSHVTIVRPNEAIDSSYLHRLIQSPLVQNKIDEMQSGSTNQVELSKEEVLATTVPLPPLAEQRRIVVKIDSLSAKSKRARDHLDHVTKLVRKYREAVLALAFRGGLTQDLRNDEQADRADSEITNQLPTGWRWSFVGEVAAVSGGLTKNSKRASLPIEAPYLRVANVYSNELRLEDVQQIRCSQRELEATALREGDLLVVEGNGSLDQIGRVAIWDGSIEPCSHQNHLIRVRAHEDKQPKHILYWLLSPLGRAAIESVASSSSGLHTLSISKVSSIRIPVCPGNESLEIIRRIEAAFAWIDRLASEAKSARKLINHLDKAILSKAFRGELVPQDPNDEPASVLLERIRTERAGATAGKGRRGRTRKDAA